ncbi:MAG: 4Fe-4S dicluster domain-containing protein [Mycobacteriales bacterium]
MGPAMTGLSTYRVSAACVGCGACLATCPDRAFRPTGDPRRPLAVLPACRACGECVEVCPVDAIEVNVA